MTGEWARVEGTELVVVQADAHEGPGEVARQALTTPGRPSIRDEHYPPRPGWRDRPQAQGALGRRAGVHASVTARSAGWLPAAAAGTTKLRRKLAEAVALAQLLGPDAVDKALAVAADAGRFGDGDAAAILVRRRRQADAKTLATATVDRLLQRAHVPDHRPHDSYRLAQATAGKGARPLA